MAPPAWTTYEQEEFLKSKRPDYMKAKQDHHWTSFWQNVCQGFFAQWPNQAAEVEGALPMGVKHKRVPQTTFGAEQDWITDRKGVNSLFTFHTRMFIVPVENSKVVQ